jgi:15-cis-phytoene synthase
VAASASRPTAAADAVVASARAGEPDRYLAALLAPPAARSGLLALAAFAGEIARVPYIASSEPAIGEIRLQWWRDALQPAGEAAARTGNPIADALRAATRSHALPRALLLDIIETRSLDVAGEAMADDAALHRQLWKSEGALFALAGRILAPDAEVAIDAAAAASGHAYGLTRLLLDLPRTLSRGRVPVPQSRLAAAGVTRAELLAAEDGRKVTDLLAGLRDEVRTSLVASRQCVANLPREARTAFLPLALVQSYLRALERPGRDLLRAPVELMPLTRVVRIAMAHWLGRI